MFFCCSRKTGSLCYAASITMLSVAAILFGLIEVYIGEFTFEELQYVMLYAIITFAISTLLVVGLIKGSSWMLIPGIILYVSSNVFICYLYLTWLIETWPLLYVEGQQFGLILLVVHSYASFHITLHCASSFKSTNCVEAYVIYLDTGNIVEQC